MPPKSKTLPLVQPDLVPSVPETDWNDEVEDDVRAPQLGSLVVYSRDWTIETINNQIEQKNIDLNPAFQRRNAWNDARRSKLIESLIAGLPVPEVVLAEDPEKKKAFLVIDGKQRLLTIAGFMDPTIAYWNDPSLQGLTILSDLNGETFENLRSKPAYANFHRDFLNADVRCTVIANATTDALYDIFYRLNTGSVPLSNQELRQVLHKGKFADYLIQSTNTPQPIHRAMGLEGPDARLRDAEVVLRFMAIILFGSSYSGNLKAFLDDAMRTATAEWSKYEPRIKEIHQAHNQAIDLLQEVFGPQLMGRKFVDGKWEGRFNRALFEVEAFYFRYVKPNKIAPNRKKFLAGFQALCSDNKDFRASIEATTKTNERYETRFTLFRNLVNTSFGSAIAEIPITARP